MVLSPKIEQKIFTPDALKQRIQFWRVLGDKIVFTNGCYDVLHVGHIHLLSTSTTFGDRVIVGLNTDKSVRKLKGESRPINNELCRAALLASLFFVDAVVLFDEDTPENLIHWLCPDVLVKGGDYKAGEIVGGDFVEENGGEVKIVPYLKGFSSTEIIAKKAK